MPTATASSRRVPVFLEGLHSPFGMALVGDDFYVANTDALLRFPYRGRSDADRPAGRDGGRAAGGPDQPPLDQERDREPGRRAALRDRRVEQQRRRARHGGEEGRAAIWEIDPRTGEHRIFASGLRNPVGLAFEPETGALWTAVNERDELGSDLVPDYMTAVRDGGFYGWPYSYYGDHVDARVEPQRPDLVARRSSPTTRSARTPPRSASPLPTAPQACRPRSGRRVRRPARLLEPPAAQRLQGHLRAVRGRAAGGRSGRRADLVPGRGGGGGGPGGGGSRSAWAGGGRWRGGRGWARPRANAERGA